MPSARARRATSRPIPPIPIMPSIAPDRSRPRRTSGPQVFHSPDRTKRSPSTTRRAAANSSAIVYSAVVALSTPGVRVTRTMRRLAATTSMLSKPVAMLLTTSKRVALSSSSSSMRSDSRVSTPSLRATSCTSSSRPGGSALPQTAISALSASWSSASPGRWRVTNTRGFGTSTLCAARAVGPARFRSRTVACSSVPGR